MARKQRPGGLTRAVPTQEVGRCGLPEHDGYGALCFGCAISLAREERREAYAQAVRIVEGFASFKIVGGPVLTALRDHIARVEVETREVPHAD